MGNTPGDKLNRPDGRREKKKGKQCNKTCNFAKTAIVYEKIILKSAQLKALP